MKLTKQKLNEMIEEAMKEGNEAQEILKILSGWWSAAEIAEWIRESYTKNSDYRKTGYNGTPMGADAFFEKYYVGKSFKLEFLSRFYFGKANRFQKKYANVADAIAHAVTAKIMKRFPDLKELADWGFAAGNEEVSRVYPNTQKIPTFRFKPEVFYLAKAIMGKRTDAIDHNVALLQSNIDGVRELQASDFDYEGKAPVDWKGYTPK